ncbi:MAG: class I SAM-dependent methyltransferase [Verrucomicrobia bacterium]|nr:class I SAM-dependent methyltransferase [Verrucomicrobiota bacterium]
MTSADQTKRNYERRPYPNTDPKKIVSGGGTLPPLGWMQAIGRPGRPAPQRVLVAGCGTGTEAFAVRREWPDAEIVAVDFSPRTIAVARRVQRAERLVRPITFLTADLTDPGLARLTGGDFDLITCHGVLSYLPQPGRVLRHLAACLRPDGALYLGVNGEAHPATRLRPWLASFGLAVDELKDERRLRTLLGLWDSLHDDDLGELSTMSASYLGGDICGPHFNNWPLAQWRAEANRCGWEIAGTAVHPMALRLTMERAHHRELFPASPADLAATFDQARPAGFHRILLRRAPAGGLDVLAPRPSAPALCWTGFFSVRFSTPKARRPVTATLRCPTFDLRVDLPLTIAQVDTLRALAQTKLAPATWKNTWMKNEASRRTLWLLSALGAVAVQAT